MEVDLYEKPKVDELNNILRQRVSRIHGVFLCPLLMACYADDTTKPYGKSQPDGIN